MNYGNALLFHEPARGEAGYTSGGVQKTKGVLGNKYVINTGVECNTETHLGPLWKRFTDLGYTRMYWCPVRNYNPDNYNGVDKNVFGSSGVINVLMISPKLKARFEYLEPVIGPDDSYKKMYDRVANDLTSNKKKLL